MAGGQVVETWPLGNTVQGTTKATEHMPQLSLAYHSSGKFLVTLPFSQPTLFFQLGDSLKAVWEPVQWVAS